MYVHVYTEFSMSGMNISLRLEAETIFFPLGLA